MNELTEQQPVRYSRFWERVGAALTDSALMYLPMMVLELWVDTIFKKQWVYWIIATSYFVLLEGPMGNGQTLGKRLFGLRVLSKEGKVLSYAQSLKRYIILSILPSLSTLIGFEYLTMPGFAGWAALALQQLSTLYIWMDVIVMASDRQKRSLHDYLSGTVVLKTRTIIPQSWPEAVEPLTPSFPWKRQWPGMILATLFVGMLLAITIGVRKFSAGRPEYTFGQTLIPTGVTVDGVRVQGDRVELDAVITSLPLMGAISRRPERISRRLELATRRLISRRLIDPQTVHQVVFWVRASAFSKTAPTDRWIVDTKSLLATFSDARTWEKMRNSAEGEVGQPALQNHMDSYNAPSSVVQEFDRIAENAKFLLTGISLPSRPDEKTALIREGQEDGFEACMKAIYPGNPEMARPSGWTKITLSKEQGCESALTLVTRMARASLIAYATSLATASKTKELVMDPKGARWLKRSRPTRLPKSAAEQKEMAAAASHGINGCLGWMFGNDFQPKVLPDTQSLESVGYVDPADGCRDLSLRVMEKLLASEPAKK